MAERLADRGGQGADDDSSELEEEGEEKEAGFFNAGCSFLLALSLFLLDEGDCGDLLVGDESGVEDGDVDGEAVGACVEYSADAAEEGDVFLESREGESAVFSPSPASSSMSFVGDNDLFTGCSCAYEGSVGKRATVFFRRSFSCGDNFCITSPGFTYGNAT